MRYVGFLLMALSLYLFVSVLLPSKEWEDCTVDWKDSAE